MTLDNTGHILSFTHMYTCNSCWMTLDNTGHIPNEVLKSTFIALLKEPGVKRVWRLENYKPLLSYQCHRTALELLYNIMCLADLSSLTHLTEYWAYFFLVLFDLLLFRLPVADACGRGHECPTFSLPLATCLCAYTAIITAAFPWCSCPVYYGFVPGLKCWQVPACPAVWSKHFCWLNT